MFDNIVSLGFNCEVSFRIEDYFGKLNAMPFSWALVMDRDKFVDTIRFPKMLLKNGAHVCEYNRMLVCNKYDVAFHPRRNYLPIYGDYTTEMFDNACTELFSRVDHLADKFVDLCKSNESTLFVMKVEDKGTKDNIKYIKSVADALKEVYVSGKYKLAVVLLNQAVDEEIKSLNCDTIEIYGVRKFGYQKRVNITGDIKGWYNIFFSLTGVPSIEYRKRVRNRRITWFIDTVKRKLHIKSGH